MKKDKHSKIINDVNYYPIHSIGALISQLKLAPSKMEKWLTKHVSK